MHRTEHREFRMTPSFRQYLEFQNISPQTEKEKNWAYLVTHFIKAALFFINSIHCTDGFTGHVFYFVFSQKQFLVIKKKEFGGIIIGRFHNPICKILM